jgi:Tfp pilus assembly protein PilW
MMKTPLPFVCPGTFKTFRAGWTLVEMMVAMFCGLIILASLTVITVFASRSYLAIANYRDLDKNSRNALDVMSRDIRSMAVVTSYSPSAISLSNIDGSTVAFSWNPATTAFTRTYYSPTNNTTTTTTLLTNCTILVFHVYSQVPTNSFQFPDTSADVFETKLIDVSWRCARSILGSITNSESVQTAKIVIRNHS